MPQTPLTPPPPPAPPEDYHAIAEKVRSGEYFNEAQSMYDLTVHDPMSERYVYIGLTAVALLTTLVAFSAVDGLFPLRTPVPFIVGSDDIVDNYIHISPLPRQREETPATAVLHFLVRNYVMLREKYNIDSFERDSNGVVSQSSDEVAAQYQREVDRNNPQSPIALYQRHSQRSIEVLSSRLLADGSMSVVYEAAVDASGDRKLSRWEANIAFRYGGIALDDKTGNPKPLSFTVTKYTTKRIQD